MSTRTAQRAAKRRAVHNQRFITQRPSIRPSDTVGASSQTPKNHRPRNTFYQRGWSDVSPYYFNAVTIDRRWDK